MKLIKFFIVGIVFGIVLTKAEAVSWYRIYEMFMFQSLHMYGIIATAILVGVCGIKFIKSKEIQGFKGAEIDIQDKDFSISRYIIGGTMFGLGWGLVGCCPGPIFILIGNGVLSILVVLIGALLGTYLYGILKNKLPH
ncbi:MAG: transporter [Flavobacteriales bacterium]|nr:MAG: transporter [Flavobacteriales bacterium]